jgi:hypothetical protein
MACCVISQDNARMFGKNVDETKMDVKVRMEKFLAMALKKFYISIWSCMKFENVLKILPMFMLEFFLDQFIFIWGHEQCSKTFGEITPKSYYY